MRKFLKEWWLQIVLLVVIIIGVGIVETQSIWAPRVNGEYMLFRLRNDGLSIVPQHEILSASTATGKTESLGTVTFNTPWTLETNTRFSTTTALWLTNTDNNKLLVYSRGKGSYDAYAQMLETTPADARLFGPTEDFVSAIETLALKKEVLFGNSPIYGIETNNGLRGFISPVTASSSAAVLFTPNGYKYQFVFSNLTSLQIDQTLQSIREAK